MAAWTLVPCLVSLREEFDQVSPNRDKGADGSIGDSAHTSSSDHTPDEDSDVLRDHDADSKNEVHALDIDSSGPWPGSVTDFSAFNLMVRELVAREKAEYESPTMVGRLKYVIWNRQIASRSWGWTWRPYTLADPHTNHAHFSARYESGPEADTRPWGVAEEDDMALSTEDKAWIKGLLTTDKDVAAQLQARPWQYGGRGIPANLTTLGVLATAYANAAKAAGQDVDESAIVAGVLEGLSGSTESDAELAAALQAALGDRATAIGRILATAPQSPVA